MPPRVREVEKMLVAVGFRRKRQGKGDHTVYARGTERVVPDGGPNHELSLPFWKKLRKQYGLKER
jgi:predicted RNA binding protein YcfA (HicA-like mRNA interferase family)